MLAERAIQYTARHQRPNFSWYYGEARSLQWVDNFHTAYVLDSFKYYAEGTGDNRFESNLAAGYRHWKKTFFLPDVTTTLCRYARLTDHAGKIAQAAHLMQE
jgi:hypothetical protein